jgi:pimeloyl-ACP methyl ester carboxylesterase
VSETPTVVFVHGAFTDGASWAPVTRQLLDQGYSVRVPPISIRSLSGDSAYLKSFVEQIDGPVVLAGHSYGGAVITVAGVAKNVVGLIYVAAYAPAEGESIEQLHGGFADVGLAANLVYSTYPVENGEPGTDVSVKIEAFPELFAAGVDPGQARTWAVSQRPLSAAAFGERASAAAWKSKPAWGIVASADRAVNPDLERFGYERAGFRKIFEIEAPHLVMQTHPAEVATFVVEAIAELG